MSLGNTCFGVKRSRSRCGFLLCCEWWFSLYIWRSLTVWDSCGELQWVFFQLDALPVTEPTLSRHWRKVEVLTAPLDLIHSWSISSLLRERMLALHHQWLCLKICQEKWSNATATRAAWPSPNPYIGVRLYTRLPVWAWSVDSIAYAGRKPPKNCVVHQIIKFGGSCIHPFPYQDHIWDESVVPMVYCAMPNFTQVTLYHGPCGQKNRRVSRQFVVLWAAFRAISSYLPFMTIFQMNPG